MKIKNYLTSVIILLAVLSSCKKENPIEIDSFSISYLEGSSWVDYSYNVTIDQNGFMQVTETNGLTKLNRKSVYRLIDNDLILIKAKLSNVVNIDISDKYGFDNENAPTDLPITKLTYKTKDRTDSTWIYYPKENELPVQFASFLHTVEQLILEKDTFRNNNKK